MNHKIRLGPIAIFLLVIAIILTTLATLTFSTTNADKVMAERFAAVTSIRYELEAEGQQFLKEYSEQAAKGAAAENSTKIERDGYTLEIEVSKPDANGEIDIIKWQLTKNWNAEDPYQNVWKGDDR